MIFHATDLLPPLEDDLVEAGVAAPAAPPPRKRRAAPPMEALAWAALEVLAFGPLIGYLLATLLGH